jgi:cytochrome c
LAPGIAWRCSTIRYSSISDIFIMCVVYPCNSACQEVTGIDDYRDIFDFPLNYSSEMILRGYIMSKHLSPPALTIAMGLLGLAGSLWTIDLEAGTLWGASAKAPDRYPAQPVGWNSPARQCVVCHSLEKGGLARVAPNLWGIVGAPKARAAGYGYSQALVRAGGVWTRQELDQYLTKPDRFLPGTSKSITGLPDTKERTEIIEFLATLKD